MNNSRNALIRVLLVDDSPVALEIISQILSSDPHIQIVGKARNGAEALTLITQVYPTIVCTDYFMPIMSGLELTKKIIEQCPMPILVISGKLDFSEKKNVFSLLEAGALDCIKKPESTDPNTLENKQFISKVRILSEIIVLKKRKSATKTPSATTVEIRPRTTGLITTEYKVIAIGASTGGPVAIQTILKKLPKPFPLPILITQHISFGFLQGFADWINETCQFEVAIVEKTVRTRPGVLYLPQENTHLEIVADDEISSSNTPPLKGHRPSIDYMLSSVAKQFGDKSIGIVLTGMGSDGAAGLLEMRQKGALTIAQSESSCVIFGMPAQAIAYGGATKVLDISEIPLAVIEALKEEL
jgi:two-component system chemotaxis response regulator CheB